jgi:aldose 1-epimerase
MPIQSRPFGFTGSGEPVTLFTLSNDSGMQAQISDLGGILVGLTAADRHGAFADVVLGLESAEAYLGKVKYLGALIGRVANRTRGGFSLGGKRYELALNNGENSLHGGLVGFDRRMWNARTHESAEGPAVSLSLLSPDAEESYPGNLTVEVTYTLTHENALRLDYVATTDQLTVINLTNHAYFNLCGATSGRTILDHHAWLDAGYFTPISPALWATGEVRPVHGTPFDFTALTRIGDRVHGNDEQLSLGGGYDHNWVFNKPLGELARCAELFEPESGRAMEVYTTQPGVQFYDGNHLTGVAIGKGGIAYASNLGVCLETQHFPNSANIPHFPSTELRPGQQFSETTIYKFLTR